MDGELGVMNKHSIVKNPTWCGQELQSCRASYLRVGDRVVTPAGEARISEITFAHHIEHSSVLITCALPVRGDFTFELKPSQWVMRLEQGGSRKKPVVRNVSAGGVSAGDWVYVGGGRCHKVLNTPGASGDITAMILDPEARIVDGGLLDGAHPLDVEEQSLLVAPASGLLLFTGPASSTVSILDEGTMA